MVAVYRFLSHDLFYMCLCGTTIESRTDTVEECEIYQEKRDALEEMRNLDVCDMEEFGRLARKRRCPRR